MVKSYIFLVLLLCSQLCYAQQRIIEPVLNSGISKESQAHQANKKSKKYIRRISYFNLDASTGTFSSDTAMSYKYIYTSAGELHDIIGKRFDGGYVYLRNFRPVTDEFGTYDGNCPEEEEYGKYVGGVFVPASKLTYKTDAKERVIEQGQLVWDATAGKLVNYSRSERTYNDNDWR
jgi:hypothetical protein